MPCIAIVTVDAPPHALVDVVAHARAGLAAFPDWEGFLDGTLHVSTDGGRLVQLLRWRDEDSYHAAMDHPSWASFPTTAAFMAHVGAGTAQVDARLFQIVATAEDSTGS